MRLRQASPDLATSVTIVLILALAGTLSLPAGAQPAASGEAATGSEAVALADRLFAASAWEEAAQAYEKLVVSRPQDGRLWYRYGMSLLQLGRSAEAVTAFEKAEAIGHHPLVMYNLACALARSGRSDDSLEWLEKAAAAGFSQLEQLDTDPDLASLRRGPRWQQVRQAVERQAHPCMDDEAYRGLDFWIGDWDVRTAQGQPAGESHVELILGSCVVFENWRGFRGTSGKSFNFVDPVTRQWKQTWVDDKGDVHEYVGEILDGAMHFRRETRDESGKTTLHRMTLFPLEPGHVRQLGESSSDGGTTWSVQYDLDYTRRTPSSALPTEP